MGIRIFSAAPFQGAGGAVVAILMAVSLWGSSFVVMKLAFRVYDPVVVVFSRLVLASIFFFCFRPFTRHVAVVGLRDALMIVLMGLCEPCMYFVFELKALQYTTASQASMILAILPLMVAVSAALLWRESLPWQRVAGFVGAFLGVILLTMDGSPTADAPDPLFGNLMEGLAMVCATGYTLLLKKLSGRYPAFMLTGYQSVVGALFFLPGCFLPWVALPDRADPFGICAVIYLGVVVSLGAYALFNTSVSRLPASRAAAFLNLIPVVGLLMGWSVLGEQLVGWQWIGVGAIFVGVWISQGMNESETSV